MPNVVNVWYSSQSGTSEHLSQLFSNYLLKNLKFNGQECNISLNSVSVLNNVDELKNLQSSTLNVFFISSFGEGEPCDDGVEFFKLIDSVDSLSLTYSLFGCGNSQYDIYQAMAIQLDEKLTSLQCKRVASVGFSDESKDIIDDVFDEWLFDYLSPLVVFLGENWEIVEINDYRPMYLFKEARNTVNAVSRPPYHELNPFVSQLDLDSTELINSYLKTSVPLLDSRMKYTTGDHLGILPQNSLNDVLQLLKILKLSNEADQLIQVTPVNRMNQIWFPKSLSYKQLLSDYVEINGILSRRLIKGLIKFLDLQTQQQLLTLLSNRDEFESLITKPKLTLVRFLEKFNIDGSCIPVSFIIENFGKLKPRFFSIASSNTTSPSSCQIIVKLIKEETFHGVLSNWVQQIADGNIANRVPVYIKKSKFKLPFDLSKPIVLVGAGTGIAPLLGFLQDLERKADKCAMVHLFYGLRNLEESLLDEAHYPMLKQKGKLVINYAVSKLLAPNISKQYVQDVMLSQAQELNEALLADKGYIFICGDALGMCHGVNRALVDILGLGKKDLRTGHQQLQYMKSMGRYKEDVW